MELKNIGGEIRNTFENAKKRLNIAQARHTWKRLGVIAPQNGQELYRSNFFDSEDNPQYQVLTMPEEESKNGYWVSVSYSPEQKQENIPEMVRVTRGGRTESGYGYSVSITHVKNKTPELWIGIKRPNDVVFESGSRFVLDDGNDAREITERFPEFDGLIPHGTIDAKATMASLSTNPNAHDLALVVRSTSKK